jgi:hypothetical protein
MLVDKQRGEKKDRYGETERERDGDRKNETLPREFNSTRVDANAVDRETNIFFLAVGVVSQISLIIFHFSYNKT